MLCRFVGCMEEANVLEIGQLGNRVACDIIQTWLRKAGRHLTNFQVFEYRIKFTFSFPFVTVLCRPVTIL